MQASRHRGVGFSSAAGFQRLPNRGIPDRDSSVLHSEDLLQTYLPEEDVFRCIQTPGSFQHLQVVLDEALHPLSFLFWFSGQP